MATYAGAPPGSGANFAKLKGALAARGAHDPGALAGWIGRKKYGRKGMAKLSAKGHHHEHSNSVGLASDDGVHSHTVTHGHAYTEMGHTHAGMGAGYRPQGDMREGKGTSGGVGSFESGSAKLRTAQGGDTGSAGHRSQQLEVRAKAGNYGSQSNTGQRAVSLAHKLPVASPWDIVIGRGADGSASVRHRRGGVDIGTIKRGDDGNWSATPAGGKQLAGHTHQRAALMELLGTWNRGSVQQETAGVPYAQAPTQTPLMEKYGVPAIKALATPTVGASDGPRSATSAAVDTGGLTPKGKAIYAKLRGRGFPPERAMAFAKRAQNMGAGSFKKAGS